MMNFHDNCLILCSFPLVNIVKILYERPGINVIKYSNLVSELMILMA